MVKPEARRLGKGLGALLGEYLEEPAAGEVPVRELEIDRIRPNPFQPRRQFQDEALNELEASIRDGDAERMGRAAYALKSSSANLGAGVLASLSLELERLGRAGELSGAKDLFARLSDEHPRVLRALEAELGADPR